MVQARRSHFSIGIAPTGRARCRGRCKQRIPKGATRLVEEAIYKPGRCTRLLFCMTCAAAVPLLAVHVKETPNN